MQLIRIYDRLFHLKLQDHEILVLNRYVKLLKNAEITDIESLLNNLLTSQVDFILDSLVNEADIKMSDIDPRYTLFGRCKRWLGMS